MRPCESAPGTFIGTGGGVFFLFVLESSYLNFGVGSIYRCDIGISVGRGRCPPGSAGGPEYTICFTISVGRHPEVRGGQILDIEHLNCFE